MADDYRKSKSLESVPCTKVNCIYEAEKQYPCTLHVHIIFLINFEL